MKRIPLWLSVALLTFAVGITISVLWGARYISQWQHSDTLCGVSDIENPLCNYSSDLHEVPTIDFCYLVHDPQAYDRKIIRIRGTFYSEDGNPFGAYLQNRACDIYQERIGANYWNEDTISKLTNYLDAFAPYSRMADVTVVGEFIDRAGHGYETMGGDRFLFIILRTEEMSLAAPVPPNNGMHPTRISVDAIRHVECCSPFSAGG